jgi:hypothetical protein
MKLKTGNNNEKEKINKVDKPLTMLEREKEREREDTSY